MVSKTDKNQSVFTKTKELGKFVTKNCEKKLDPKTRIVMETNHKMCIVMVYKICQSEQIDKNKKNQNQGFKTPLRPHTTLDVLFEAACTPASLLTSAPPPDSIHPCRRPDVGANFRCSWSTNETEPPQK
jgi:hypothetical protein